MRFTHTLTVGTLLIGLLFLASYMISSSAMAEISGQGHSAVIEAEILSSSFAFLGLVSPSLFLFEALSVADMRAFFFNLSAIFLSLTLVMLCLVLVSEKKLRPILNIANYASWIAAGVMIFYGTLIRLIFGPAAVAQASELYRPSLGLLIDNAFRTYIFFGGSMLVLGFLITSYLRSKRKRNYVQEAKSLRDIGRKFDF